MNTIFLYFLIFIYGAAMGSFVNVIVSRWKISSPWSGRSKCMSCNKKLSWYELLPVFSYLFLGGRCRKCKVKIDREYLWTEIFSGTLAVMTYIFLLKDYFDINSFNYNLSTGILFSIFYTFLFVLFLIITLYDLKHKIVPLLFSSWIIIIGLATEFYRVIFTQNIFYNPSSTIFWLDIFSGILIALPFFLIFLFSKGKAVGGGDILLFLGIGYLAGFVYGVSIFLLSIWIGATFSIILLLINQKYNRKSEIPFAPFILIATIIVLFWKIDVMGLSLLF